MEMDAVMDAEMNRGAEGVEGRYTEANDRGKMQTEGNGDLERHEPGKKSRQREYLWKPCMSLPHKHRTRRK